MLGRCDRTYLYHDGAELRVRRVQDSSIEPLYVGILRLIDIDSHSLHLNCDLVLFSTPSIFFKRLVLKLQRAAVLCNRADDVFWDSVRDFHANF